MGAIGNFFGGLANDVTGGIKDIGNGVGDLFSGNFGGALSNLGGAAMDAAPFLGMAGLGPIAGMVGMGGALAGGGAANAGQQGGGGFGMFAPNGSQGFNPDVLAVLNTPWGMNLMANSLNMNNLNNAGQQQLGVANTLNSGGTSLWSQGLQGLPSLSNLGTLGNEQNILNQQASLVGLASPFGDFGSAPTGPNGLTQPFQQQYNANADMVAQGRQSQLSQLQAQMAAQGITDPRAMASAEANINAQANSQLGQTLAGLGQEQLGLQTQTAQQFAPEMANLYNAQQQRQDQLLGYGLQALAGRFGSAGEYFGSAANQGLGIYNNANNQLGSLYGLGLGYPNPFGGGQSADSLYNLLGIMPGFGASAGGTLGADAGQAIGSALGGGSFDPTSLGSIAALFGG